MLNNCPGEIIFRIASYLNSFEKLNLIKTCHRLNYILSSVLFEELKTPRQKTGFMLKQFEDKKLNGAQVKKLVLYTDEISLRMFARLPHIFPNIEELKQRGHFHVDLAIDSEAEQEFEIWKDTLHRYSMSKNSKCIFSSLRSYTFSRLVDLELFATFHSRFGWLTINDVCCCIRNTPSLKTLSLSRFVIYISSLEDIHTEAPMLKSLVFTDGIFDTRNKPFPQTITPFPCLQTFRVGYDTDVYDDKCFLLKYIALKYPNIQNLYFLNSKFYSNYAKDQIFDTNYKKQFFKVLSELAPQLKALEIEDSFYDYFARNLKKNSLKLKDPSLYQGLDKYILFQELAKLWSTGTETSLGSVYLERDEEKYVYKNKSLSDSSEFFYLHQEANLHGKPTSLLSLEEAYSVGHTKFYIISNTSANQFQGQIWRYDLLTNNSNIPPGIRNFIRDQLSHLKTIRWRLYQGSENSIVFNLTQQNLSFLQHHLTVLKIKYTISTVNGQKQYIHLRTMPYKYIVAE